MEEDPQECTLLGDTFAKFIQVLLALICFSSLVLKRQLEVPKRTIHIWALDSSKQAASSLCAHLSGMVIATWLESITDGGDQCSWYFVTFSVDTTLGVTLGYAMLQAQQAVAERYGCHTLTNSGDYGDPPNHTIWCHQLSLWCVITVAARLCCGGLMFTTSSALSVIASAVASPFKGHPQLFLTLVMVGCPVGMNIVQLWIQDTYLKSKQQRIGLQPETLDSLDITDGVQNDEAMQLNSIGVAQNDESMQLKAHSEL